MLSKNNILRIRRDQISSGVEFVEKHLRDEQVSGRERTRTMLMTEESLVGLFAHAPRDAEIRIQVRKFLGNINIMLRAPGEDFDFFTQGITSAALGLTIDSDEDFIRSQFLKSFEDKLKFQHKDYHNLVKIMAVKSRYTTLYTTLGSMVLGLLAGLLLKICLSPEAATLLNDMVLSQITMVFMNLLKMVVGPIVFFSIASSIAGFGDIAATGRIGLKIMALYIGVSLLAIGIGIGSFFLFHPGDPSLMSAVNMSFSIDTSAAESVTLLETITGIFPSNILTPFLEANMLQIIFIAVMTGICAGMIGSYGEGLQRMLNTMNDLFLKMTMLFVTLLPLVAFCSMASMVMTTGGAALISILKIFLVILICYGMMCLVYAVLLLISGVNPLIFFRKYFSTFVQVCALSSSNASIPLNMDVSDKKLGISPKVYSLTIPLGATVNMHGYCIFLSVMTLAFAHAFGITISSGSIFSMVLSILLLSMGAPGIPGSGIVVLAVIFSQMGIPVTAVSLVIGINPLIDMFITGINCLGDVTSTAIVGKSEHLMDMDRFNA